MGNRRNIKFEKISRKNFIASCEKIAKKYNENINLDETYDNLKLPVRKTKNSAGYDFFIPFNFTAVEGETILIPTGIRCSMDEDLALEIYPRSSYGFKYGMRISNTVGIIDSDYYHADNEGHIMIKIMFDNVSYGIDSTLRKSYNFNAGDAFVQGIFKQYFISMEDSTNEKRVGGTGSTGN